MLRRLFARRNELEDRLLAFLIGHDLEQLATAEGDVLENIALIENLEDSKKVSTEIAEKMEVAVTTEKEINVTSCRCCSKGLCPR